MYLLIEYRDNDDKDTNKVIIHTYLVILFWWCVVRHLYTFICFAMSQQEASNQEGFWPHDLDLIAHDNLN